MRQVARVLFLNLLSRDSCDRDRVDIRAQESFYKGKVIRIIEAYDAGGGYDTYARVIARHLGKHIPGNPTVAVENMTGAGGLIAVNYLYNRAEPDGLTIANWNGSLSLQQYLGQKGIQFDSRHVRVDRIADQADTYLYDH